MEFYQKILLFLLLCIPVRCLLAFWASKVENSKNNFQYILIGLITLAIGLGFFLSKGETGAFGSKVYWYRNLHGFLYLLFTTLWFFNVPKAYIILILDVVIGLVTFLGHYLLK